MEGCKRVYRYVGNVRPSLAEYVCRESMKEARQEFCIDTDTVNDTMPQPSLNKNVGESMEGAQ